MRLLKKTLTGNKGDLAMPNRLLNRIKKLEDRANTGQNLHVIRLQYMGEKRDRAIEKYLLANPGTSIGPNDLLVFIKNYSRDLNKVP